MSGQPPESADPTGPAEPLGSARPQADADTVNVSSDAVPRRGLAVKVVAVVVVLALVAGAAALAFTVLRGEPERSISLPATAAGMDRAPDLEGDQQFAAVKERVSSLIDGVDTVEIGAYQNTDTSRGPAAPVFVIGGETTDTIDPQQFLDAIRKNAQANDLPTRSVPAGDDAQGLCVTNAAGDVAGQCVWATTTSFGQVLGVTQPWTPAQLAGLMVQVRADVETTE